VKFHLPTTIDEAVALLASDEEARCLAGGATLVAMMNADLLRPAALVSLRHVPGLAGIARERDGAIAIGAMTTHATIAAATGFDGGQRVVQHAAEVIGHPAIRNMGTIGGSIAHGDPAADYPAALVAAGAAVEIVGPNGKRDVPAEKFFVDYLETDLKPGELVSRVRLPASTPGAASAYEKFCRVSGDFATVSVAVVLALEGGRCRDIRIAIGACAPVPLRVPAAEDMLKGGTLDGAAIAAAAERLAATADPVDDFRGSAEYRLMLIPELLKRAIGRARSGQGGKP
jgi:carbon-monoxide dehydrogenase medium subunit